MKNGGYNIDRTYTMIHYDHKTLYKYGLIAILVVFCLALISCRSKRASTDKLVYVHDTTIVEKRYVDTAIVHEADSASARLLAECDENNQVLISEIDALNGKLISISPKVKYVYLEDKETGEKLRKAQIDIIAMYQEYEEKIKIYEESITKYKEEREDLKEEIKTASSNWVNLLGLGFALGCLVSLIVFSLIGKVSNKE